MCVWLCVSMKKGILWFIMCEFPSLLNCKLLVCRDPALICIKWNIFISKLQTLSKFLFFTEVFLGMYFHRILKCFFYIPSNKKKILFPPWISEEAGVSLHLHIDYLFLFRGHFMTLGGTSYIRFWVWKGSQGYLFSNTHIII